MKNDPNKNGMTYASHTLPSLHLFTPHHFAAPPNTYMPITYPFIIIHAIHKLIPSHTTTACSFHTYFHIKKTHYVSNMLHADDAPNRQKRLPLSTSFHASIMQHVHLELHYRHHPTQAFTGLPPRRSLLPTPIGSTHHLCTKLIHVPTEHTLQ